MAIEQFQPIRLLPAKPADQAEIKPAPRIRRAGKLALRTQTGAKQFAEFQRDNEFRDFDCIFEVKDEIVMGIRYGLSLLPGHTTKILANTFEHHHILRGGDPCDWPGKTTQQGRRANDIARSAELNNEQMHQWNDEILMVEF